jgi:flagellar basal-body rod protein FlgB
MKAPNDLMALAATAARHAAARHDLAARNIANADTPGYRARDIDDFTGEYDQAGFAPFTSRTGHLAGAEAADDFGARPAGGELSPNGNDVSIETEMVRDASARREHDAALAVYRASLDILRSSLGRR